MVKSYSFRVVVQGDPSFTNELNFKVDGGTVAAHVVNAISIVCEAEPGIVGLMERPHYFTKDIARN